MLLVDASGVIAAADAGELFHHESLAVLAAARGRLVMSPFVLAELDYLVPRRVGRDARHRLLTDVAEGAFKLERFDHGDIRQAAAVIERFADLGIGLADASLVVLAHRYNTNEVLTLDERHFRVLPAPGGHFRVLPADA